MLPPEDPAARLDAVIISILQLPELIAQYLK